MAKILLVEDDNNLREIFEMRVQAEGFETVTAGDGEEGLVVAMKEKPDLIVADVMMPKLSGFEMLETLRASPEMANTKVIMMTALGQADDQARGEKLGVVKYLVKSQVTLEDFARVIKEVLNPDSDTGSSTKTGDDSKDSDKQADSSSKNNNNESEKSMPEDTTPSTDPNVPAPDSGVPAPDPAVVNPISSDPASSGPPSADPSAPPSVDGQQSSADEQSTVNDQINSFVSGAPAADPSAPPAGDNATPTEHTDVPVADPPADSSVPPAADPSAPPAGDAPSAPAGL